MFQNSFFRAILSSFMLICLFFAPLFSYAENSEIYNELQDKIDKISSLGNSKIEAKIKSGDIVLSGVCSSEQFKTELIKEVKGISGIRNVIDEIIVDSNFGVKVYSDQEVFDTIVSELNREQISYSNLEVKNGKVRINLNLDTFREVDEVLSKIRGMKGVVGVESDSMVKGKPYLDSIEKNY